MTDSRESRNQPPIEDRKAENLLADQGVFAGHQGLRGLAEADSFWESQPYGTRLYYGSGGLSYLNRGVLRAAVAALDAVAKSEAPAAPAPRYDESMRQQALAWRDVAELLNGLAPGWSLTGGGSGADMALAAIRKLSKPSETPAKLTVEIPDGWQIVPKAPTPEMVKAAHEQTYVDTRISDTAKMIRAEWRVMLKVAPKLVSVKEFVLSDRPVEANRQKGEV